MKLAFVDLLFSWPPHGGANVDLYHVLCGLQAAGQEVHLVGVAPPDAAVHGAFSPRALPFPATRLTFSRREFNRHTVPGRIRAAVDGIAPDAVVVADGFFLKPYVCRALMHYPVVSRFYAYEAICHKDILHYKGGAPCLLNYLETPEDCRRCALEYVGPAIRAGFPDAWARSYVAAHAYAPAYHALQRNCLRDLTAAVVYNDLARQQLADHCAQVFVFPGGVDAERFAYTPAPERVPREGKVILMTGRAEDPVKGLDVLLAAGERLWRERRDFVIWATLPEDAPSTPWFRAVGWRAHEATPALYRQADVVVVPSVWDEPFGLTALEAMASGRPVCASRVGGLCHTVRHLETGFLFPRGDAEELAKQLALLLDNAPMRLAMGRAGRAVVEAEYSWPNVVAQHYTRLLAFLAAESAAET